MTQFEFTCPNDHSVKFTLEMCGRTAQCPKCSARFEVPTLKEVREMLGDEISEELEKEFQAAEKKLQEYAKAKAAKAATQAPQAPVPAKPHEFDYECPNKDSVKFTLEMCGHTAKCPKCGVRFDVPKLEEVRKMLGDQVNDEIEREFKEAEIKYQEYLKARAAKRALQEKEAREKAEQETEEQAAKEKVELEKKEKPPIEEKLPREEKEISLEEQPNVNEEMISFLCPNGHPVEAPVSAAGKKGRCPECGAKFMVPSVKSVEEAAQNTELELNPEKELSLDENPPASPVPAQPPKITVSKDSYERAFLYPNLAVGKTGEIDIGLDEAIQSIPEALKMDPMAKLFWTFWTSGPQKEEKEKTEEDETPKEQNDFQKNVIGKTIKSSQAGKIEIQTADGRVFIPTEFYEDKSLSPIGYFEAYDENQNLVTLAIRWDNVVRIVLRK